MKSIHIRDLSEATLAGLKRRAARHRRSLQKEVQFLLEEASRMDTSGPGDSEELNLQIVRTGGTRPWNREEIYGDGGR